MSDKDEGIVPVNNALISVYYKDGIVEMAKILNEAGVNILSTGGTYNKINEAGIPVQPIEDYTGFPEMFGGRVKTLHPMIHGGILYRRNNPQDVSDAEEHEIISIDLVVVNLYPFSEYAKKFSWKKDKQVDEIIEQIDIGGPTMIRGAAKNYASVGVVVDPKAYSKVQKAIKENGGLTEVQRRDLAADAFDHTFKYDHEVATFFHSIVISEWERTKKAWKPKGE